MLQGLSIKGYKVIQDEMNMDDFSHINYFVGENGSGKSSVFEIIKLAFEKRIRYGEVDDVSNIQFSDSFMERFGHIQNLFKEDASFNLNFYNVQSPHHPHKVEYNYMSLQGKSNQLNFNLKKDKDVLNSFDCEYISFADIDKTFSAISRQNPLVRESPFKVNGNNFTSWSWEQMPSHVTQEDIKNVLNRLNIKINGVEVQSVQRSLYRKNDIIAVGRDKDAEYEIVLKSLSSGQRSMLMFYFIIENSVHEHELQLSKQGVTKTLILLIEEPELSLHPKYQKQLPILLEEVQKKYEKKVQLFISTHSPFVLSNVSGNNESIKQGVYRKPIHRPLSKVYVFDNGMLKTAIKDKSGVSGYSATEDLKFVVADMLGAEASDFGYPDNYVILEENSMLTLLQILQNKGIVNEKIQFISAGSDTDAIRTSLLMKTLTNYKTLLKCNPFYVNKFYIIIDKPNAQGGLLNSEDFAMLKQSIGDRFIKLSKDALEEYYPEELQKEFYEEFKKLNSDDYIQQGYLKAQFAIKFAEKISSKEDFEKYFESDMKKLAFLLN